MNDANIAKLIEVLEMVSDEPRGLNDLDEPGKYLNMGVVLRRDPQRCRTVACICGWITVLREGSEAKAEVFVARNGGKVTYQRAAEWLGIDYLDAVSLFEPKDIDRRSHSEALETLERLRETGDVVWQDEPALSVGGF